MPGEDFILFVFLLFGAGQRLHTLTLRQVPCQRVLPLELSSRTTPCHYLCVIRRYYGYSQRLEIRQEVNGVPCWQREPGICLQGKCIVAGYFHSEASKHGDPLSSKGILLKRRKRSADSFESAEGAKKTNFQTWIEKRRARRKEIRLRRQKIAAARRRLRERRKRKRLEKLRAKQRAARKKTGLTGALKFSDDSKELLRAKQRAPQNTGGSIGAPTISGNNEEWTTASRGLYYNTHSEDEETSWGADSPKMDTSIEHSSGVATRQRAKTQLNRVPERKVNERETYDLDKEDKKTSTGTDFEPTSSLRLGTRITPNSTSSRADRWRDFQSFRWNRKFGDTDFDSENEPEKEGGNGWPLSTPGAASFNLTEQFAGKQTNQNLGEGKYRLRMPKAKTFSGTMPGSSNFGLKQSGEANGSGTAQETRKVSQRRPLIETHLGTPLKGAPLSVTQVKPTIQPENSTFLRARAPAYREATAPEPEPPKYLPARENYSKRTPSQTTTYPPKKLTNKEVPRINAASVSTKANILPPLPLVKNQFISSHVPGKPGGLKTTGEKDKQTRPLDNNNAKKISDFYVPTTETQAKKTSLQPNVIQDDERNIAKNQATVTLRQQNIQRGVSHSPHIPKNEPPSQNTGSRKPFGKENVKTGELNQRLAEKNLASSGQKTQVTQQASQRFKGNSSTEKAAKHPSKANAASGHVAALSNKEHVTSPVPRAAVIQKTTGLKQNAITTKPLSHGTKEKTPKESFKITKQTPQHPRRKILEVVVRPPNVLFKEKGTEQPRELPSRNKLPQRSSTPRQPDSIFIRPVPETVSKKNVTSQITEIPLNALGIPSQTKTTTVVPPGAGNVETKTRKITLKKTRTQQPGEPSRRKTLVQKGPNRITSGGINKPVAAPASKKHSTTKVSKAPNKPKRTQSQQIITGLKPTAGIVGTAPKPTIKEKVAQVEQQKGERQAQLASRIQMRKKTSPTRLYTGVLNGSTNGPTSKTYVTSGLLETPPNERRTPSQGTITETRKNAENAEGPTMITLKKKVSAPATEYVRNKPLKQKTVTGEVTGKLTRESVKHVASHIPRASRNPKKPQSSDMTTNETQLSAANIRRPPEAMNKKKVSPQYINLPRKTQLQQKTSTAQLPSELHIKSVEDSTSKKNVTTEIRQKPNTKKITPPPQRTTKIIQVTAKNSGRRPSKAPFGIKVSQPATTSASRHQSPQNTSPVRLPSEARIKPLTASISKQQLASRIPRKPSHPTKMTVQNKTIKDMRMSAEHVTKKLPKVANKKKVTHESTELPTGNQFPHKTSPPRLPSHVLNRTAVARVSKGDGTSQFPQTPTSLKTTPAQRDTVPGMRRNVQSARIPPNVKSKKNVSKQSTEIRNRNQLQKKTGAAIILGKHLNEPISAHLNKIYAVSQVGQTTTNQNRKSFTEKTVKGMQLTAEEAARRSPKAVTKEKVAQQAEHRLSRNRLPQKTSASRIPTNVLVRKSDVRVSKKHVASNILQILKTPHETTSKPETIPGMQPKANMVRIRLPNGSNDKKVTEQATEIARRHHVPQKSSPPSAPSADFIKPVVTTISKKHATSRITVKPAKLKTAPSKQNAIVERSSLKPIAGKRPLEGLNQKNMSQRGTKLSRIIKLPHTTGPGMEAGQIPNRPLPTSVTKKLVTPQFRELASAKGTPSQKEAIPGLQPRAETIAERPPKVPIIQIVKQQATKIVSKNQFLQKTSPPRPPSASVKKSAAASVSKKPVTSRIVVAPTNPRTTPPQQKHTIKMRPLRANVETRQPKFKNKENTEHRATKIARFNQFPQKTAPGMVPGHLKNRPVSTPGSNKHVVTQVLQTFTNSKRTHSKEKQIPLIQAKAKNLGKRPPNAPTNKKVAPQATSIPSRNQLPQTRTPPRPPSAVPLKTVAATVDQKNATSRILIKLKNTKTKPSQHKAINGRQRLEANAERARKFGNKKSRPQHATHVSRIDQFPHKTNPSMAAGHLPKRPVSTSESKKYDAAQVSQLPTTPQRTPSKQETVPKMKPSTKPALTTTAFKGMIPQHATNVASTIKLQPKTAAGVASNRISPRLVAASASKPNVIPKVRQAPTNPKLTASLQNAVKVMQPSAGSLGRRSPKVVFKEIAAQHSPKQPRRNQLPQKDIQSRLHNVPLNKSVAAAVSKKYVTSEVPRKQTTLKTTAFGKKTIPKIKTTKENVSGKHANVTKKKHASKEVAEALTLNNLTQKTGPGTAPGGRRKKLSSVSVRRNIVPSQVLHTLTSQSPHEKNNRKIQHFAVNVRTRPPKATIEEKVSQRAINPPSSKWRVQKSGPRIMTSNLSTRPHAAHRGKEYVPPNIIPASRIQNPKQPQQQTMKEMQHGSQNVAKVQKDAFKEKISQHSIVGPRRIQSPRKTIQAKPPSVAPNEAVAATVSKKDGALPFLQGPTSTKRKPSQQKSIRGVQTSKANVVRGPTKVGMKQNVSQQKTEQPQINQLPQRTGVAIVHSNLSNRSAAVLVNENFGKPQVLRTSTIPNGILSQHKTILTMQPTPENPQRRLPKHNLKEKGSEQVRQLSSKKRWPKIHGPEGMPNGVLPRPAPTKAIKQHITTLRPKIPGHTKRTLLQQKSSTGKKPTVENKPRVEGVEKARLKLVYKQRGSKQPLKNQTINKLPQDPALARQPSEVRTRAAAARLSQKSSISGISRRPFIQKTATMPQKTTTEKPPSVANVEKRPPIVTLREREKMLEKAPQLSSGNHRPQPTRTERLPSKVIKQPIVVALAKKFKTHSLPEKPITAERKPVKQKTITEKPSFQGNVGGPRKFLIKESVSQQAPNSLRSNQLPQKPVPEQQLSPNFTKPVRTTSSKKRVILHVSQKPAIQQRRPLQRFTIIGKQVHRKSKETKFSKATTIENVTETATELHQRNQLPQRAGPRRQPIGILIKPVAAVLGAKYAISHVPQVPKIQNTAEKDHKTSQTFPENRPTEKTQATKQQNASSMTGGSLMDVPSSIASSMLWASATQSGSKISETVKNIERTKLPLANNLLEKSRLDKNIEREHFTFVVPNTRTTIPKISTGEKSESEVAASTTGASTSTSVETFAPHEKPSKRAKLVTDRLNMKEVVPKYRPQSVLSKNNDESRKPVRAPEANTVSESVYEPQIGSFDRPFNSKPTGNIRIMKPIFGAPQHSNAVQSNQNAHVPLPAENTHLTVPGVQTTGVPMNHLLSENTGVQEGSNQELPFPSQLRSGQPSLHSNVGLQVAPSEHLSSAPIVTREQLGRPFRSRNNILGVPTPELEPPLTLPLGDEQLYNRRYLLPQQPPVERYNSYRHSVPLQKPRWEQHMDVEIEPENSLNLRPLLSKPVMAVPYPMQARHRVPVNTNQPIEPTLFLPHTSPSRENYPSFRRQEDIYIPPTFAENIEPE